MLALIQRINMQTNSLISFINRKIPVRSLALHLCQNVSMPGLDIS